MPDSQGKNLIFLVGCPRSGTSKLTYLLNSHPQIAASSETHFFNQDFDFKLLSSEANDDTNFYTDFFNNLRIQDFFNIHELDEIAFKAEVNSLSEPNPQKKVFLAMMNLLAAKNNKKITCEKTPQHLLKVKHINQLFPEAKFIHIYRDPRDVINSLLKMPWRPDGLVNNARFYKKYFRAMLKIKENCELNSRFIHIAYEDLLKDKNQTLKQIYTFLGLSAPPDHEEIANFQSESDEIIQKSAASQNSLEVTLHEQGNHSSKFKPTQTKVEASDDSTSQNTENSTFASWENNWKYKAKQDIDLSRAGAYLKELKAEQIDILNHFLAREIQYYGYNSEKSNSFNSQVYIWAAYLKLSLRKLFRLV